jgi:hypothetical protein
MLYHRKQAQRYGCLWHAPYALTGDKRLLEHVEEIGEARWRALLAELGYLVAPIYMNVAAPNDLVHPGFWESLRVRLPSGEPLALLVTIDSSSLPGGLHLVALTLTKEREIWISDSARDEPPQYLPWPTFLNSPYANAYRVEALMPADLSNYPPESARESLIRLEQVLHPELTL